MPKLKVRQLAKKIGIGHRAADALAVRHEWPFEVVDGRGTKVYDVPDAWLEQRLKAMRAKVAKVLPDDLLTRVNAVETHLVAVRKEQERQRELLEKLVARLPKVGP